MKVEFLFCCDLLLQLEEVLRKGYWALVYMRVLFCGAQVRSVVSFFIFSFLCRLMFEGGFEEEKFSAPTTTTK